MKLQIILMQKKRQLSRQIENGGNPKKQCEEPTLVDNVFKRKVYRT